MTVTQSKITNCMYGIRVSGHLSLYTSHLQLSNVSRIGINLRVTDGIVTLNNVRAHEIYERVMLVEHVKWANTTPKRHSEINIFNSTLTPWNMGFLYKYLGSTNMQ